MRRRVHSCHGDGCRSRFRWRRLENVTLLSLGLCTAFIGGGGAAAVRSGWRRDSDNSRGLRIALKRQARPGVRRRLHYSSSSQATPDESEGGSDLVLKDYFNNQYVGQVGVGTPPQVLSVVFDTGSSDIWIPGRGCTQCGDHQVFDFEASSSYVALTDEDGSDKGFEVDYGSGKVTGYQGTETMSMGSIAVERVGFGEVMFEDEEIRSFMMDGIVGLGFSGLSMVTKPTLLELFHEQHPDVANHFSVFLSSDPTDSERPSTLMLGGYDLSLVSSDGNATWHYTPVVRYGYGEDTYWSVKVTSVSVMGRGALAATPADSYCSAGCKAIVDTGTSELGIPSPYYQQVMALVTAGLNCKDTTCYSASLDDFPDLRFGLYPDNVLPLRAEDYVSCSRWGQCIIRLQEVTGTDFWILGDVFLEAYYTLFDVENMRVGFACVGQCSGGTWHGVGGFVEVETSSLWLKVAFLGTVVLAITTLAYVVFNLLPYAVKRVKGYKAVVTRQEPLVSAAAGEEEPI